ncbi:MAG: ABC transporter substrate-binding protein [Planctomycetota bacterium]|jgi:multiple sugar transport system substrate-binding protein/raffinose/stachyose/melibiose transport system substrate-binding protein
MDKGKAAVLFTAIIIIPAVIFYYPEKSIKQTGQKPSQKISLYHYFSGTLSGGMNEAVTAVNNAQSKGKVEAVALDHEAFKSMIISTLEGGDPPELFAYWAGARVQELVDAGKLEPIDDLWKQHDIGSKFSGPVAEAACTYNGKKYLLPITQHITLFFYNKKIFAEEKLTPPKTWDEFLKICSSLKEKNINPIALGARERWPAQFWFDYLLLQTAGPEYREKLMRGEAGYSDPEVLAVYKIWGSLLKNGFFNPDANKLDWAEATEKVCRNESAMTLMGTWAIQMFEGKKYNWKGGEEYDFFPFPVINEKLSRSAVGPLDGIVMSKGSENCKLARHTMVHFAGDKAQKDTTKSSGGIAPSKAIARDFYSPFQRRILDEINSAEHWAFNYDLATRQEVAELGMDSFQELIQFPDQYTDILKNLDKEARFSFEKSKEKY